MKEEGTHNIPIQFAWTLATIAILYAVLQRRYGNYAYAA